MLSGTDRMQDNQLTNEDLVIQYSEFVFFGSLIPLISGFAGSCQSYCFKVDSTNFLIMAVQMK